MSVTREARHLSGNDLGKTISYTEYDPDKEQHVTHTGRLREARHQLNYIETSNLCDKRPRYDLGAPSVHIELLTGQGTFISRYIGPSHQITITGTD